MQQEMDAYRLCIMVPPQEPLPKRLTAYRCRQDLDAYRLCTMVPRQEPLP